jgi:hypothetical protein
MERLVMQNDSVVKGAPLSTLPSVPPKSKADERAKPADASPRGGPAANSTGLAGTWIYRSQPGAWTGYGEPQAITLVLQEQGGALAGTYEARLPLRDGTAHVRLALTCVQRSADSARLHWKSETPAGEGDMEIKLASDGRLFVERGRADDSYFPRGTEVLQRQ